MTTIEAYCRRLSLLKSELLNCDGLPEISYSGGAYVVEYFDMVALKRPVLRLIFLIIISGFIIMIRYSNQSFRSLCQLLDWLS